MPTEHDERIHFRTVFAHLSDGEPCQKRASVSGSFGDPARHAAAFQPARSNRDLRGKCSFQLGKADFLRVGGRVASFRDPMTNPARPAVESKVSDVNVDQRLSFALSLLYTVGTRQRSGSLGSVEQPLLSGCSGERDRLRVRREHTATNHPKRTQVSCSRRRSSTGCGLRDRSQSQREVSAARDQLRYGSLEPLGSRLRPRPTRPGEETA